MHRCVHLFIKFKPTKHNTFQRQWDVETLRQSPTIEFKVISFYFDYCFFFVFSFPFQSEMFFILSARFSSSLALSLQFEPLCSLFALCVFKHANMIWTAVKICNWKEMQLREIVRRNGGEREKKQFRINDINPRICAIQWIIRPPIQLHWHA